MEAISPFAFVTIVTLISGAGGTGLGGIIGALFNSKSNKVVSLLLAFAGGVMSSIVCFDLLIEATESAQEASGLGVWIVVIAFSVGIGVVYGLNVAIDRKTSKEVPHTGDVNHPKTHDDLDELIHADHLNEHIRR